MRPPLAPAFPGDSDEVRDAEGRVYLLDDVNAALAAKDAEIAKIRASKDRWLGRCGEALAAKEEAEQERDEARRERDEAVAILRYFERYTGWDAKARAKKLARLVRMEEALRDMIEIAEEYTAQRETGGLLTHNERRMIEEARAALAPADDGEGEG